MYIYIYICFLLLIEFDDVYFHVLPKHLAIVRSLRETL